MVVLENDNHARGLIAMVVCDDPWYRLTRDMIGESISLWLGIPRREIDVEFFLPKGYLLLLPLPSLQDRVLDCNIGLVVSQAKI
jgi:hypothetical protein